MSHSNNSISHLLADWRAGDGRALDALVPRVQGRLRRQAEFFLRRERRGQTLQPTALVNEAFLRLLQQRSVRWRNRRHFFAVAAFLMRRILVDLVRRRRAARRGADPVRVSLGALGGLGAGEFDHEQLALRHALEELAQLDPRQEQVVVMRYFTGLSVPEVASVLGVSISTVESDWRMARAWLHRRLSGSDAQH